MTLTSDSARNVDCSFVDTIGRTRLITSSRGEGVVQTLYLDNEAGIVQRLPLGGIEERGDEESDQAARR